MTAPHSSAPTAMELLANSPAAPLLNKPVPDVLAHLGLPPLPELPALPPLPQLPPLPHIDLTALFKPLTDLLAGFGSGDLSALPFNPTEIFTQLSQALQSAVGMGSSAMSALSPLWSGAAATSALTSGTTAQANGAATSTQSAGISTGTTSASAVVARGAALLQGVIASFAAVVAAVGPALITPPGVAIVMGAGSTHLATGLAIVAETRAELTMHTGQMLATANPVAVTAVPQALSSVPTTLSSAMSGMMTPFTTGMSSLTSNSKTPLADSLKTRQRDAVTAKNQLDKLLKQTAGGAGKSGGGGGGAGGASVPSAPLGNRSPDPVTSSPSTRIASSDRSDVVEQRTVTTKVTDQSGYMPMGGAAGAGMAGAAGAAHTPGNERTQTLSAPGNRLVGELPSTSPPIVGAPDTPVLNLDTDSASVGEPNLD